MVPVARAYNLDDERPPAVVSNSPGDDAAKLPPCSRRRHSVLPPRSPGGCNNTQKTANNRHGGTHNTITNCGVQHNAHKTTTKSGSTNKKYITTTTIAITIAKQIGTHAPRGRREHIPASPTIKTSLPPPRKAAMHGVTNNASHNHPRLSRPL